MNNGGDAAEQVVRLSLEGFEVAARLSGSAAKNIALLLVSVLKQEQKTKGKARLTNMIKSGKELKVFSIPQKDLKKFTEQAKRYGDMIDINLFLYSCPHGKQTSSKQHQQQIYSFNHTIFILSFIKPLKIIRAYTSPSTGERQSDNWRR